MIRKIFFFFALSLLTGCANIHNAITLTPHEKKTVFIDSNIAADVYIGDINVGTTPYMADLSGEEREMISLRKTGYKTAELPLRTTYRKNYRPAGYAITKATSSNCQSYMYVSRSMMREESCESYINRVVPGTTLGVGILFTAVDITPDPKIIQYDRDSYFIEMIPENKKAFTKEELRQMRIRMMVLRTFKELKASSPEYVFALSRLTGGPFVPPAPAMTPGDYFRSMYP